MDIGYKSFITSKGEEFTIDPVNHTICGNNPLCHIPQKYQVLDVKLNEPGFILLENGSFFRTGSIEGFNVPTKDMCKVYEIKTAHSTYILDTGKGILTGGVLPSPIRVDKVDIAEGQRGIFYFKGTPIFEKGTSTIVSIVDLTESRQLPSLNVELDR